MKTFCFVVEVKPSQSNPAYNDINGGIAHVMATDSSIERAERRIIKHLFEDCWNADKIESSVELTPQLVQALDELLYRLYLKAQRFGIAVLVEAGAKSPSDPDGPIEVRLPSSIYPPKE
jgi:hypothetical protein